MTSHLLILDAEKRLRLIFHHRRKKFVGESEIRCRKIIEAPVLIKAVVSPGLNVERPYTFLNTNDVQSLKFKAEFDETPSKNGWIDFRSAVAPGLVFHGMSVDQLNEYWKKQPDRSNHVEIGFEMGHFAVVDENIQIALSQDNVSKRFTGKGALQFRQAAVKRVLVKVKSPDTQPGELEAASRYLVLDVGGKFDLPIMASFKEAPSGDKNVTICSSLLNDDVDRAALVTHEQCHSYWERKVKKEYASFNCKINFKSLEKAM